MQLVDIRVPQAELEAHGFDRLWFLKDRDDVFNIDWQPPASGPEAQVTFQNTSEKEARAICRNAGLTVLASRVREVRSL